MIKKIGLYVLKMIIALLFLIGVTGIVLIINVAISWVNVNYFGGVNEIVNLVSYFTHLMIEISAVVGFFHIVNNTKVGFGK